MTLVNLVGRPLSAAKLADLKTKAEAVLPARTGMNEDDFAFIKTASPLTILRLINMAEQQSLQIEKLYAALKLTEFGFNHVRCPVCAGWNVGPNGETDKVHTKNCPVAEALVATEPRNG